MHYFPLSFNALNGPAQCACNLVELSDLDSVLVSYLSIYQDLIWLFGVEFCSGWLFVYLSRFDLVIWSRILFL